MQIKALLIFICLFTCAFSETYYFFIPPKHWKIANPELLSSSVEIGFIGKSNFKFRPSINLATESVSVSMETYIKEVKKIYNNDRATTFRDLGKLSTKAGISRLLEITKKTKFGEVKILQAIFLKNKKIYVLTGAMESKGFLDMYKTFIKAFKSFTFTDDLLSVVQSEEKLKNLQKAIASFQTQEDGKIKQKKFNKLQKMVANNFKELGSHWELTLLKDIQKSK